MEYSIGMFARAKAGHDTGKLYIISKVEDEYVYLVDGKIRTIDNPKKKRKKHIQVDYQIAGQARNDENNSNSENNRNSEDNQNCERPRHPWLDPQSQTLRNEEIKRAIKLKNDKSYKN